ncbi:uncharacterized protein [Panulirus ornatus]|uniref:uncharacterized protein n=1 Tax=Panulirus ornatus TaxID=150431 RepID=UPI003A86B5CF
MYRKYLQELNDRPATSQPRASPDTVFPDTNLIVGGAHLKAARAGAAHREQLSSPRLNNVLTNHSLASDSGTHSPVVNQPSTTEIQSLSIVVVHSSAVKSNNHNSSSVVHPLVIKPDNRSTAVSKTPMARSDTYEADGAKSSVVKDDVFTRSPTQSAHSTAGVFTRCSSAVSYSSEVKFEVRGRRDPRRYSEAMQLEDIMSRDNTPEFRRRPLDYFVTEAEDVTASRAAMSSRTGRPSPISVWDSQSIPDVSEDEVIMARPVMEASRVKSPLYPTPRGDLLSSSLMENVQSPHAFAHTYSQDVIMVRSASQDSKDNEEPVQKVVQGKPETRKENGLPKPSSKLCGNLQGELTPWGRHSSPPRPPTKKAGTARETTPSGCYSMFCCSVRPSSSASRR